jgi:undecaprenyl-diphosphatase
MPQARIVIRALFPPPTSAIHRGVLAVGLVCAAAVLGLSLWLKAQPYLPLDAAVERSLQSAHWGPLASTFPFFSWLGGSGGGPYMELTAAALVLLFNRRAWLYGGAILAGGLWYPLLVNWVERARPTAEQVVRVIEHPGATSFPSGHVMYITLSFGVLMLGAGHRYLPPWARVIGWLVVAAVVLTAALSRLYVGVHWPTDVLGGMLLAAGWICLVTSIRWLSDRALYREAA